MDFYQGILQLMALIPTHLSCILFETVPSLAQMLRFPHKSPWTVRFQVRHTNVVLQTYHVNFMGLQPTMV